VAVEELRRFGLYVFPEPIVSRMLAFGSPSMTKDETMEAKAKRLGAARAIALRDSLRDLRTAEIELREPLGGLERDWVLGQLRAQSGIEDAAWVEEDERSLLIEYDADLMSGAELVNFLYVCGLSTRCARRAVGSARDGA
jgi:hypothetical protein